MSPMFFQILFSYETLQPVNFYLDELRKRVQRFSLVELAYINRSGNHSVHRHNEDQSSRNNPHITLRVGSLHLGSIRSPG